MSRILAIDLGKFKSVTSAGQRYEPDGVLDHVHRSAVPAGGAQEVRSGAGGV